MNDNIVVQTHCTHCHQDHPLEVSAAAYKAWKAGTLIQHAFPKLSPDQREMLMTGICGSCWSQIFAEEGD